MTEQDPRYDWVIEGGEVIDPATGLRGRYDLGLRDGRIAALEPDLSQALAAERFSAKDLLVVPGLIDTHAHVYQHVTGRFGLAPDLVGVQSGVTTIVDQGGPSCMTIGGYRHFIHEPSQTRALCFISAYLVGGLEGHYYPELYGPGGVNAEHTIRVARENLDLVKGVKAHAELGGQSRWGLDVIRVGKEISSALGLPLYIHLGQLWPTAESAPIPDPDTLIAELLPIMEPGDILAHPFTRHAGGFVSAEGVLHPIILEAVEKRGIKVDVGHGSHFSFAVARQVLAAGITPDTLGADMHGYNVSAPGSAEDAVRSSNPFHGVAPFNLTVSMSGLLHLGLSLETVLAMVTSNPAAMLGMADEIGSLQVGHCADVSLLSLDDGPFPLTDNAGGSERCEKLLRPKGCFRAGRFIETTSPFVPDIAAA